MLAARPLLYSPNIAVSNQVRFSTKLKGLHMHIAHLIRDLSPDCARYIVKILAPNEKPRPYTSSAWLFYLINFKAHSRSSLDEA